MRFVERFTDGSDQVVVLRYAAAFYWLMWLTLAITIWASLNSTFAATVAAIVAWIASLLVSVPYWPVVFELKRRMRTQGISASGSKYSFTNPLTYRWPQPTA
jgi:hypothetical protein